MGWHFRKSKNIFGLFRLNFSGKGIGYSYGSKFARVTHSATGRKTLRLSLPGTGLYYNTTTLKKGKRKKRK